MRDRLGTSPAPAVAGSQGPACTATCPQPTVCRNRLRRVCKRWRAAVDGSPVMSRWVNTCEHGKEAVQHLDGPSLVRLAAAKAGVAVEGYLRCGGPPLPAHPLTLARRRAGTLCRTPKSSQQAEPPRRRLPPLAASTVQPSAPARRAGGSTAADRAHQPQHHLLGLQKGPVGPARLLTVVQPWQPAPSAWPPWRTACQAWNSPLTACGPSPARPWESSPP